MKRKKTYNDIHNKYKEERDADKDLKTLYNQIKREYISDKNLDITYEKLYLKKKIENYKGDTFNTYQNIIMSLMVAILVVSLENIIATKANVYIAIFSICLALGISFISLIVIDKKVIRKEIDQYVYYNVCLEVISDIEKGKARE